MQGEGLQEFLSVVCGRLIDTTQWLLSTSGAKLAFTRIMIDSNYGYCFWSARLYHAHHISITTIIQHLVDTVLYSSECCHIFKLSTFIQIPYVERHTMAVISKLCSNDRYTPNNSAHINETRVRDIDCTGRQIPFTSFRPGRSRHSSSD